MAGECASRFIIREGIVSRNCERDVASEETDSLRWVWNCAPDFEWLELRAVSLYLCEGLEKRSIGLSFSGIWK